MTSRPPVTARSSALLLIALIALIATACGRPSATPAPTGVPPSGAPTSSAPPSASPGSTVGAIEHATGAIDVVLRLEQGGGLVPMEFLATQAPVFTLFGDGVIVFQPATTTFPEPNADGITKGTPWRTARLDEGQIQDLLEFALGLGGLGAARDSYPAIGVADAPDTIFTIRAGGISKRVVVNALGIDTQAGPDLAARAAFAKLAARLQDFDRGGSVASDVYRPDRNRGILTERDTTAGGAVRAWPWAALKPADFQRGPADGSGGPTLAHRILSADEAALLQLSGIEGGVRGLAFKGPDGKSYGFILRPLLADEKE